MGGVIACCIEDIVHEDFYPMNQLYEFYDFSLT